MNPASDNVLEELVDRVRHGDIHGPAQLMTMRYIEPVNENGWGASELANFALTVVTTPGANPHRTYQTYRFKADELNDDLSFPSDDTWRQRLYWIDYPDDGLLKPADHDMVAYSQMWAEDYNADARALMNLGGYTGQDVFITIDGSPSPFYGRMGADGHKRITVVGYVAKHIMRKKVGRTQPFYNGTNGGHEWLHVTLHTLDGGVSITLYIELKGKNLDNILPRVVQILDELPFSPRALVADNEFMKGRAVDTLRRYADRRNVTLIGPLGKEGTKLSKTVEAFTGAVEKQQRLNLDTGVIHWENVPMEWSASAHASIPFNVFVVYEPVDHEFDEKETSGRVVQPYRAPGPDNLEDLGDDKIVAFPLYCNAIADDTNALFLATIYARRWACEALFARYGTWFGRSQGKSMLPRQFLYQLAFGVLNKYGLWRQVNGEGEDGGLDYAFISHNEYLTRLRTRCEPL